MFLKALAIVAALALPGPAFAQHHGPGGPGGGFHEGFHEGFHGGEHEGFGFHGPGVHFGVGPGGFHGHFLGFGRHWYNGRWWNYGEGDCWAIGPDGRWWWVCGD